MKSIRILFYAVFTLFFSGQIVASQAQDKVMQDPFLSKAALYDYFDVMGSLEKEGVCKERNYITQDVLLARVGHDFDTSHVKSSLSISDDGVKVVLGYANNNIRVWDTRVSNSSRLLQGHEGPVNVSRITADGSQVVSGDAIGDIKVWDFDSGQCLSTLRGRDFFDGNPLFVNVVDMDGYGSKVVIEAGYFQNAHGMSTASMIKVVDIASGQCLQFLSNVVNGHYKFYMSFDGSKIVAMLHNGPVSVWDVASGQCLSTFQGNSKSVAITPDGSKIIIGCEDGLINIYDVVSEQCLHTLQGGNSSVISLKVTTDGLKLFSKAEVFKQWAINSGACLHAIKSVDDRSSFFDVNFDGTKVYWVNRHAMSTIDFTDEGNLNPSQKFLLGKLYEIYRKAYCQAKLPLYQLQSERHVIDNNYGLSHLSSPSEQEIFDSLPLVMRKMFRRRSNGNLQLYSRNQVEQKKDIQVSSLHSRLSQYSVSAALVFPILMSFFGSDFISK